VLVSSFDPLYCSVGRVFCQPLSHRLALELDAVGLMNESIVDGIGGGRVTD